MGNKSSKVDFKNFLVYNTSVWVPAILNVLLLPIFTAYLTPGDYGIRAIVFLAILVLEILSNFGLNWVIRAKYYTFPNRRERDIYLSSLFIITFIPKFILFMTFMFFMDYIFPNMFGSWNELYNKLFTIQLFIFLINYPNEIFFAIYVLQKSSKRYSSLVLLKYFSNIIVSLSLLILFNSGIISLFYGELIGAIVFQLMSAIHFRHDFTLQFDKRVLKDLLAIGVPAMPKSLFQTVQLNIDKYILQLFMPISDIGIFTKSQFVHKAASGLNKAFSNAYSPTYLRAMTENNKDYTARELMSYWLLLISLSITFSMLFLVDIFRIIHVNPEFWICAKYAPFYAINILITSYALMYGNNILLSGKTYYFTIRSVVCGIVNITANIILIPIYGITGAILATIISGVTFFIIELYISEVYLNYRTQINLTLYAVALSIISIIYFMIYHDYLITFTSKTIVMGVVIVLATAYEINYLSGYAKRIFQKRVAV